MKFKKGDAVYYHPGGRHDIIPAIVKAVGGDSKRSKQVWVYGETERGYINSWVHISNVELQSENP